MTPRIGDVWQHPLDGSCFRVMKVPRHMKPFVSDDRIYGSVHTKAQTFDIITTPQFLRDSHKLIYRKPSKHPLNKSDKEFLKEVHNQIKCL
jgi:hypothetical protein